MLDNIVRMIQNEKTEGDMEMWLMWLMTYLGISPKVKDIQFMMKQQTITSKLFDNFTWISTNDLSVIEDYWSANCLM